MLQKRSPVWTAADTAAPGLDEHCFHAVADSTSDMIAVLDAEGRRLYANPALARLLGETGSLVGTDSFLDIHPDDRDRMRALFRQVATQGSGARAEYRLIDGRGGTCFLESQSNVVCDGSEPLRVVVVSRDVTERRRLEDTLSRLNRELESRIEARTAQLSAAKGQLEGTVAELQAAHGELRTREEDARRALERARELHELKLRFVSMTNHEFRTPLTTILSASELLRTYDGRFSEKERLEILDDIRSAVGRMTLMLDQVLTISRSDAGRLEFQPEPVSVTGFARDLLGKLEKAALGSHRFALESQAAETTRPLDARLLTLILQNLLSNAVKYSAHGSQVTLRVAAEAAATVFEVADEGIGIPEEDRANLFKTFFRGSNVGRIAGTGLGLAIVKRAVQRHGGAIACESVLGGGSRFIVRIPLVPGPAA
ncbi:MAG: PAS domain-containing sensor histidine kinase [Denitratisoma sp.]|nr:PAS domain-containing sensor histidine kinase [Denitratisoma sp.]